MVSCASRLRLASSLALLAVILGQASEATAKPRRPPPPDEDTASDPPPRKRLPLPEDRMDLRPHARRHPPPTLDTPWATETEPGATPVIVKPTPVVDAPPPEPSGKTERYFAAGGVWAGGTAVKVGGVRQSGTSLKAIGMQMLDQVGDDNVTGTLTTQLSLGGGDAGFDGFFGGEFTIGQHLAFTDHQGPFFRAGFAGYLGGNRLLYSSLVELPRVVVGYQFFGPGGFLEIGARAGAVLVGRYNPGEATRALGSTYAAAGFVSLRLGDLVRVDGSLGRIDPRASGEATPLDSAELSFCVRGSLYLLCGDGRRTRGTVTEAGGQIVHGDGLYAGLTAGVSYWH
jgi:hypothetical protein